MIALYHIVYVNAKASFYRLVAKIRGKSGETNDFNISKIPQS